MLALINIFLFFLFSYRRNIWLLIIILVILFILKILNEIPYFWFDNIKSRFSFGRTLFFGLFTNNRDNKNKYITI